MASGELAQTLDGHTGSIVVLAFSPDGRRIVSADQHGTMRIWEPMNGYELLTLREHNSAVIGASFSTDGHRLLSASSDGVVKVRDARPLPK
ncbi:MAG: hypothetical protein HY000_32650 [Planctomycetes bacterium]|nr:hypothetical protein [Planctomycetota bacterium]